MKTYLILATLSLMSVAVQAASQEEADQKAVTKILTKGFSDSTDSDDILEMRRVFFDRAESLTSFSHRINQAASTQNMTLVSDYMNLVFSRFNKEAEKTLKTRYGIAIEFHSAVSPYEKADYYSSLLKQIQEPGRISRTGEKLGFKLQYYRDSKKVETLKGLFGGAVAEHYKIEKEDENIGSFKRVFDSGLVITGPTGSAEAELSILDKDHQGAMKTFPWNKDYTFTFSDGKKLTHEEYIQKQIDSGSRFVVINQPGFSQVISAEAMSSSGLATLSHLIKTQKKDRLKVKTVDVISNGRKTAAFEVDQVSLGLGTESGSTGPIGIAQPHHYADNFAFGSGVLKDSGRFKTLLISNSSDAFLAFRDRDSKYNEAYLKEEAKMREKRAKEAAAEQEKKNADGEKKRQKELQDFINNSPHNSSYFNPTCPLDPSI